MKTITRFRLALLLGAVLLSLSDSACTSEAAPPTPPSRSAEAAQAAAPAGSANPTPAASAIKVTIDIPERQYDGKLPQRILLNQPDDAHFFVVVENISTQPLSLSSTRFFLGNLRFEITDEDGVTKLSEQIPETDRVFGGADVRLTPAQTTVIEVYYCQPRYWTRFPFPPIGQSKKVTLRAIFEENSPKTSNFWGGRVASEPVEVTLQSVAPQMPARGSAPAPVPVPYPAADRTK